MIVRVQEPYRDAAGWYIELFVFDVPCHDVQVVCYDQDYRHLALKFDDKIYNVSASEAKKFLKSLGAK